jgi:hypothetical protein
MSAKETLGKKETRIPRRSGMREKRDILMTLSHTALL